MKQVFEPSETRERMLTEDDDLIRAQDIPERMQLATSSLSSTATLFLQTALTENGLNDAASWDYSHLPSTGTRLLPARWDIPPVSARSGTGHDQRPLLPLRA